MTAASRDTDQEQLEINRGREAQRILEEPMLVEAFEVMKTGIVEKMTTGEVNADDLYQLRWRLDIVELVKADLTRIVQTGTFAVKTAEDRRAQREAYEKDLEANG